MATHLLGTIAIQLNLELKTWPKQPLDSLQLYIALQGQDVILKLMMKE
jgi:hypothetical protein